MTINFSPAETAHVLSVELRIRKAFSESHLDFTNAKALKVKYPFSPTRQTISRQRLQTLFHQFISRELMATVKITSCELTKLGIRGIQVKVTTLTYEMHRDHLRQKGMIS